MHSFTRSLAIGRSRGWFSVSQANGSSLLLEASDSLIDSKPRLVAMVRRLFDLDADPAAIRAALAGFPEIADSLSLYPGLRVPGAVDFEELAFRTVLGQQISVKAATTISGRLASMFGRRVRTPLIDVGLLTPTASAFSRAGAENIRNAGLTRSRAETLYRLACYFSQRGRLFQSPSENSSKICSELLELKGIGPWTVNYLRMRGFRQDNVLLAGDLVVDRKLGGLRRDYGEFASYATMHLWNAATSI